MNRYHRMRGIFFLLVFTMATVNVWSQNVFGTLQKEAKSCLKDPIKDLRISYDTLLGTSNKRWAAGALVSSLVLSDYWTTTAFQNYVEPTTPFFQRVPMNNPFRNTPFSPVLNGIDGVYAAGIGLTYLGGIMLNKKQWREAALIGGKVSLEGYVVSHLFLKTITGRQRPIRPLDLYRNSPIPSNQPFTNNPLDFFNWRAPALLSRADATAFPSFHFTLYFGLAAVADYYLAPWWVAYPVCLFPLAYTMDGHNHWVSEMVVGAMIGTSLAHGAIRRYENEKKRKRTSNEALKLSYLIYPSGGSIRLAF